MQHSTENPIPKTGSVWEDGIDGITCKVTYSNPTHVGYEQIPEIAGGDYVYGNMPLKRWYSRMTPHTPKVKDRYRYNWKRSEWEAVYSFGRNWHLPRHAHSVPYPAHHAVISSDSATRNWGTMVDLLTGLIRKK